MVNMLLRHSTIILEMNRMFQKHEVVTDSIHNTKYGKKLTTNHVDLYTLLSQLDVIIINCYELDIFYNKE